MNFIADYFAIGLVIILATFFLDNIRNIRYMPRSSKVFFAALIMTAFNAATDLISGVPSLLAAPHWLNMLINSLYFVFNLITTSCIALFLFTKILEHTHRKHCMRNALIAITTIMIVYCAAVIINIWTGILFYFDESGIYHRGPLNAIGYVFTLLQMFFVLVCYFRNRDTANKPMRRALLNTFPVIPVCIIIQRLFPEIMLNSILFAFTETVLFMTFMSQRHGIHSLTELNDRHRFFDEIDYLIKTKDPFQIFLINLKNFSAVNSKFGHLVCDEYLYQFAFLLENIFKGSITFHMNGTVFAIVLRYTFSNVSEMQSKILTDFLDSGISFDHYTITTDYIVSHYIADGSETSASDIYEIMEHAAANAYSAKQNYVLCAGSMRDEIERRRYLRERLNTIDRTHGFEVWYQPVKCMKTGKFTTMEALIRLREPDGTLISPAEFIPLAEETGEINSITWFVLDDVCKTLRRYSELDGISVSINIPMSQLLEKDFASRFTSIVNTAGIDHNRICIEFTERTIIEDNHQIQGIMKTLTDSGFRFYLDDFGAGYSNFNCLMGLPFQIIKFDAEFVRMNNNGLKNYDTVRSLTKLFHDMNLTVVAEGVEITSAAEALREIGVDLIQGYVFARPMPEKEVLRFYREELAYIN